MVRRLKDERELIRRGKNEFRRRLESYRTDVRGRTERSRGAIQKPRRSDGAVRVLPKTIYRVGFPPEPSVTSSYSRKLNEAVIKI